MSKSGAAAAAATASGGDEGSVSSTSEGDEGDSEEEDELYLDDFEEGGEEEEEGEVMRGGMQAAGLALNDTGKAIAGPRGDAPAAAGNGVAMTEGEFSFADMVAQDEAMKR